jgi:ubiquinone/menaquinone biosynthesis C-methylase UbiE
MITKDEISKGYDSIAEKVFVSDAFYNEVLDIEPGFYGDVLEAGVGQGVVLKKIAERGGKAIKSLSGIDLSDRLIAMARAAVPGARIIKADIEAMPFAEDLFDFVVMVDTFQYLFDFHQALNEVRRVLRPNGTFIVTVPNKRWILFGEYIKKRKNIQPVQDHFFTYTEMKTLLTTHGFDITTFSGADCLRYYAPYHKYEILLAKILPFLHKRMKKIVFRCRKKEQISSTDRMIS